MPNHDMSAIPDNKQPRVEAKTLTDRIYLRHSQKGHVRFSLPAELCGGEAASLIEAGLMGQEGLYRVRLSTDGCKLSIHYREAVTNVKKIALALRNIVEKLPPQALAPAASASTPLGGHALSAAIARLLGGRGLFIDKETERKATLVLNELVVLYLIRRHWRFITGQLIRHPLKSMGAWLSAFYLLFLYVRHKRGAVGA